MTLKDPPAWAEDHLSDFIKVAYENCFASYVNMRPYYDRLLDVDMVFQNAAENLNETKQVVPAVFLLRCHSIYLAAARLSLSCQVGELYMLLRGCLEGALYALYISDHDDAKEAWLHRQDDPASRQRARDIFTVRTVLDHLESKAPSLHEIARKLYDHSIDWGAHPNVYGVLSGLSVEDVDDKTVLELAYLTDNKVLWQAAMVSTARVGILALKIFRLVYKERFDILGLSDELDRVCEGLERPNQSLQRTP
jgi:hypothetical protein